MGIQLQTDLSTVRAELVALRDQCFTKPQTPIVLDCIRGLMATILAIRALEYIRMSPQLPELVNHVDDLLLFQQETSRLRNLLPRLVNNTRIILANC